MPELDRDETKTLELAFGRILRLASRPAQPGDVEEYERCRTLILQTLDPACSAAAPYAPSWPRDRNQGAQGD